MFVYDFQSTIHSLEIICLPLQIINVYSQEYESGASYWPDVHSRVIIALIFSQIVLLGLLTTKKAASSTPFLIALPVLTIWFHRFCKGRFQPAFVRFPLQVCQMTILLLKASFEWIKHIGDSILVHNIA